MAENFLRNGDFSKPLEWGFWRNWGIADGERKIIPLSSMQGHSTAIEMKVNYVNRGMLQTLFLEPGTYTIAGWLKSSMADVNYIQIHIRQPYETPQASYSKTEFVPTDWTKITRTFTVPEKAYVQIQLGRGAGNETATSTLWATGLRVVKGSTDTGWERAKLDSVKPNANLLKRSDMRGAADIVSEFSRVTYGIEFRNGNNGVIWKGWQQPLGLKTDTYYTLSFVAWSSEKPLEFKTDLFPDTLPENYFTVEKYVQKFKFTFRSSDKAMATAVLRFFKEETIDQTISIAEIKLEEGQEATDWIPAAEDSPNLVQNSHFYKGTEGWSASNEVLQLNILEEHALTIEKIKDASAWHSYINIDATMKPNFTYTVSMRIKSNIDHEGVEVALKAPTDGAFVVLLPTFDLEKDVWKTVEIPLVTSNIVSGPYYKLAVSSTMIRMGEKLTIDWLKVEEAPYATGWSAAPTDLLLGMDKPIIAQAQYTITDFNDSLSIVAGISNNISTSQSFNPKTEEYSPDWTKTNLVLTAQLFVGEEKQDVIDSAQVQSIQWYKVWDNGNKSEVNYNDNYYAISGKTFTRRQNLRDVDEMIDVEVKITYKDPITGENIIVKANKTIVKVIDGGSLTLARAWLPYGNTVKNGEAVVYEETSDYGRNLIRNSAGDQLTKNWTGTLARQDTTSGRWGIRLPNFESGEITSSNTRIPVKPSTTYTIRGLMKRSANAKSFDVFFLGRKAGATNDYEFVHNVLSDPAKSKKGMVGDYEEHWATFTTEPEEAHGYVRLDNNGSSDGLEANIWFAQLKMEEGTSPTSWSIAPEDRPSMETGEGINKWTVGVYPWTEGYNAAESPTYSTIQGKKAYYEKVINDNFSLFWGFSDYYFGRLRTAVYVEEPKSLPISYKADDASRLYLNGQSIRVANTASNIGATLNLQRGWNTVEFLYAEAAGQDGIGDLIVGPRNLLEVNRGLFGSNLSGDKGSVIGNYPAWFSTDFIEVQASTAYALRINNPGNTVLVEKVIYYDANKAYVGTAAYRRDADISLTPPAGASYIRICFFREDQQTMTPEIFRNAKVKFEKGTTPSHYTQSIVDAPTGQDPNRLSLAVDRMDYSYAQEYGNKMTNVIAKAELIRGSIPDVTQISYQWYKEDSSVKTSQGGGVGWLKLTSSSAEKGYNTDTLEIPPSQIKAVSNYKAIIKDLDTASPTHEQEFSAVVTVSDSSEPIQILVEASNGNFFRNGQGSTTLTAKIMQGEYEIDTAGTAYTYKWIKYNKDGQVDSNWGTNGSKSGKTLLITAADLIEKGTFNVEVS